MEAQRSGCEAGPLPQRRSQSLQEEAWFSHSRLLHTACVRTGSRDPDDLWDHLYEVDYRRQDTAEFIRSVLVYCALARRDASDKQLAADGCLAREQAMAAAIARQRGRTVVVTGGFHSVALPQTQPAMPAPLDLPAEDHQLVLMRYSFEQLDRLNGYASGMPSPEFYQRTWEDQDASQLLVEIGANADGETWALLRPTRSRQSPTRRGSRHSGGTCGPLVRTCSTGCAASSSKGPTTRKASRCSPWRKLLAGDRVGNVPAEAGQPPIVHDFRNTALRLKLKLDKLDETQSTLDLYRKAAHREISRLFHRLAFLDVPFATFVRGPDFVAGENLERIQEVWTYHWSPQTESSLIERSLYGLTIEEAASGLLLERFREAEQQGQGRSAAMATQLVLHACRMGLHRHTQDLLARVGGLLAEDSALDSLVTAMENLLILEVSREPLEAHHLAGLRELATTAYHRACFVIPSLVNTAPEEEARMLDALNGLFQAVRSLGDGPELQQLRSDALRALAATSGGSAALRGGAVGLLYGDGKMIEEDLVGHLRGHLHSSREDGADGPNFLRGLLKTARSLLWQAAGVLASIHEVVESWDEERFVKLLPLVRLALADLTPRETDLVAKRVAALLGAESLKIASLPDIDSGQMLRALEINRLLRAALAADGLEVFCE